MTEQGTATTNAEIESGHPLLAKFIEKEGRLPFVTDEVKPWEYRGWLLPYRMMCESHPDVAPRYAYVIATIENGKLLDEPPPRIDFLGEFDPAVKPGMKQISDMMKILEYRSMTWDAFRDLCAWLGWALGVTSEPARLGPGVNEELYRKFDLGPWLTHPTDYLGQFLAETRGGGWNPNAFYPTPVHVCEMMARMTQSDQDWRTAKARDPCVGTGRMLMVASNFCLRLFGQDIDPMVVLITKINMALYAPWHHIPESFFPADEPIEATPVTEKPVYTTKIEQPSLFAFA